MRDRAQAGDRPSDRPTGAGYRAPVMPERMGRVEDGNELPYLVWRLDAPARMVSSAVLGGGIGERSWIVNAQVRPGYDRLDPGRHLTELADTAGLRGPGVGLLTAADVDGYRSVTDGGVRVDATVGVRVPTWASSPERTADPDLAAGAGADRDLDRAIDLDRAVDGAIRPGTINIVAFVPATLTDGALVNLVATATEAKTQALLDLGIPGTGTATDAVCIVAALAGDGVPVAAADDTDADPFGGPRSYWGARLARAVHAAVRAGTADSLERMGGTGR